MTLSAANTADLGSAAEDITVDVVDGVVRLSLARPRYRNAISAAMFERLRTTLAALDTDDSVRVLVLRSNVDGVFCAGADIQTLADPTPDVLQREFRLLVDCIADMRALRKPVVAVIAGTCMGAGCALAAAADIVLASDDARFCLPEVHLDLAPVLAMQALFPVVHLRQLLYWSATGRVFSARDALQAGLVTKVSTAPEVEHELGTLLGELTRPSGVTFRYLKRAAALLAQPQHDGTHDELMATMLATATSAEARAAIGAFLDRKRNKTTSSKPETG